MARARVGGARAASGDVFARAQRRRAVVVRVGIWGVGFVAVMGGGGARRGAYFGVWYRRVGRGFWVAVVC